MAAQRFDRAVERHQRKVFTLASYLLCDPAEAEDVAQEVLLKLWRHRELWRSGRLRAWLLQVTRNACIDRLRVRRSRARFLSEGLGDHTLTTMAAPTRNPEELAAASEFSAQLRRELDRLSEPYRSAVILREIQGLSYREIAEVLELSLSNVRVTIHRGRRMLRERLKGALDHAAAC